jgi:cold shock CspA family protein
MKDRILDSYLNDFKTDNAISELESSKVFEHLVNYCIVAREHPENFDFEKVTVGSRDDLGVDGIAILVNEHLVTTKQEIDYFKTSLRRLDVQFFFIQSKTSEKFSGSAIGNFIFGVNRFFGSEPPEKINADIKNLMDLKEYIYDSSIDMDKPPICNMFYVSAGKWLDDPHLVDRINEGKEQLKKTDLFSDVEFTPIDADGIKSIYKELKLKITKEINFERHTILPNSDGVREAYIGILPCIEYLKLITDTDGNLLRKLFYDNVRDFQGNNPVNREIDETLNNILMSDKFALFNNGITIVAQSINKVGTSFKVKDYQIVNGCQTSHILFRNRKSISDESMIPIKLIVTDDSEITNLIIKATNRQSEVMLEAFESLSPFQKKLEEFYTACSKSYERKIYYERRSKQYDHLPIKKEQIISLSVQVYCFVAMFLNEPQSTHRYYGELLNANRGKIFLDNHSPFPYFLSGFALMVLENLFRQKKLDIKYRKYKYHLLMLLRIMSEKHKLPFLNSRKIEDYCNVVNKILLNDKSAITAFTECIEIIKGTLKKSSFDIRECRRLKLFTSSLLDYANEKCNCKMDDSTADVEREMGKVIWFSDVRGYGFIAGKNNQELFVHFRDIRSGGYRTLSEGEKVEYTVVLGEKGLAARDVICVQ